MFGLGADADQTLTLIPPTRLRLRGGQVVFVTGPSGSGKSTLLRLIAAAVRAEPSRAVLIDFEDGRALLPGDGAVVDRVDDGALLLGDAMRVLSLAGLNDAFVMLRQPGELSDGQRYRFAVARVMARVERARSSGDDGRLTVVLCDEFGATLDRVTAGVLARNIRRWVSQSPGVCFIAATTHDDLLEPLSPDVLIEKHLGGAMDVVEAGGGRHG